MYNFCSRYSKGSLKTGINRVEGTILGGIIGFIFAIIKAGDPFYVV